jgi:hypothetical protein
LCYGLPLFRYSESPSGLESFNRPLVDKINEVASPTYHAMLATMATTHVVPGRTSRQGLDYWQSGVMPVQNSGFEEISKMISSKPVCLYQSGSTALHLPVFEVIRELMRVARPFSRSANGVKI